jgi:hypothetical protein
MKRLAMMVAVVVVIGLTGALRADDKPTLTGSWKWSVEVNGQTRESTLKLKLEGDKLTGALIGRNNMETKIEDGKFKDGEVSFTVTRERNNVKITTKYKGKLSGDEIKGKADTDRDGQTTSRDWEAKRAKD